MKFRRKLSEKCKNTVEQIINFESKMDLEDFRSLIKRVERYGEKEVALSRIGGSLLTYGCYSFPETLLDATPTVLVHRVMRIGEGEQFQQAAVFSIRQLLDRIANLGEADLSLRLPDTDLTAVWAGISPPRKNWEQLGHLDAESLRGVATEGIARVRDGLPENPGAPVAKRVRESVWNQQIAPGVPAMAAYALQSMGFLGPQESSVRLFGNGSWRRIKALYGDVFIRS